MKQTTFAKKASNRWQAKTDYGKTSHWPAWGPNFHFEGNINWNHKLHKSKFPDPGRWKSFISRLKFVVPATLIHIVISKFRLPRTCEGRIPNRELIGSRHLNTSLLFVTRETDLRWNLVLSTRSNQDNQRYMEEEIFHRMTLQLASRQWQMAPTPIGGIFTKIQRVLAEKAQREARLAKLASTRSMATAMAAKKFKVKLNEDKEA